MQQREFQSIDPLGSLGGETQHAILVVILEASHKLHILDVSLVASVDVALAGKTRHTPHILILEEGTIAPTMHLHREGVLGTDLHIGCDVEYSLEFRILAVAHLATINPEGDVRGDRTEVHIDIFARPLGRHLD